MLPVLRSKFLPLVIAGAMLLAGCIVTPPPQRHPAYLYALSDLRAGRWLIEHRPGDWAQTSDEAEALRQIDAAIRDIRKAAFNDGRNANGHPQVDEYPDHRGRIHEALQYLNKARADIAREEDNTFAGGLRDRAIGHIDAAIGSARRVLGE
jgi:tetratricopeptide (TPR) repeat protein